MEYVICCLCSLLCFVCGAWAARGIPHLPKKKDKPESVRPATDADDALSRDIAALLAYTGPRKEDEHDDNG